jgi:hypothetical protein
MTLPKLAIAHVLVLSAINFATPGVLTRFKSQSTLSRRVEASRDD